MGILTQHSADLANVFYDTADGFALSATYDLTAATFPVVIDSPYYDNDPGGELFIQGRDIEARVRRSDVDSIGITRGNTMTVEIDGADVSLKIGIMKPNGLDEYFLTLRQV